MTEREAAMALALASGVGPAAARRLRSAFGSYAGAVSSVQNGSSLAGVVSPGASSSLRQVVARRAWTEESARVARAGARFAVPGDADYPRVLAEISDPPVGIFVSGEPLGPLAPMVAVVGSRAATPRGVAVAGELVAALAREGLTVVSGLARGVDTCAHVSALRAGGRTVAVLGCGLGCVYPPENAGLARDIAASGALVSEFEMHAEPLPGRFPRRNRLISGLSIGVVVVEAGARSGALITVARALEQGREVFAVPGPVDEPLSAGPNRLIKAGAKLTENAGDIIEELEAAWGPFPVPGRAWTSVSASGSHGPSVTSDDTDGVHGPGEGGEGDGDGCGPGGEGDRSLSRRLLSLMSLTPVSVDDLVEATGAPVSQVLSTLLVMELNDEVRTSHGGRFMLGERARRRKP